MKVPTTFTAITAATTLIIAALPANTVAAPVTYSSESAFLAAAGGLSFESFETLTVDAGPLASIPTTGFTITGPAVAGLNVRGAPESSYAAADGSKYVTAFFDNSSITFTFAHLITEFGITMDGMLDSQPQPSASISFSTNAGDSFPSVFVGNQEPSSGKFFGFASAAPFTVLTIANTMTGDRVAFDAVHFTAAEVPEQGPFMLLTLGVIGIVLAFGRRSSAM